VTAEAAVVWARADRPSRLLVEASTTESFSDICCSTFADALPESDFTAKVLLDELPAGQQIFYRVRPQDLAQSTMWGEARTGSFRTAADGARPVSIVW
jgi:alkaline phosphatase D